MVFCAAGTALPFTTLSAVDDRKTDPQHFISFKNSFKTITIFKLAKACCVCPYSSIKTNFDPPQFSLDSIPLKCVLCAILCVSNSLLHFFYLSTNHMH